MDKIPYISKRDSLSREYSLHFKISIKEYEQMKSKFSKIDHKGFEKFAKSICKEHGIAMDKDNYPNLRWGAEGELEHILVGIGCACISKESNDAGNIIYSFHNIEGADQALAALQILATFYGSL